MSLDLENILETLRRHERPKESEVSALCTKAIEIFTKESNVHSIPAPVTVCGDIHGQFEDLMELFRVGGQVPDINYLFLGDYVDRGSKGVEVILYLFCLKVGPHFNDRLSTLRGSRSFGATTRAARSPRPTASTRNASRSMDRSMCGGA